MDLAIDILSLVEKVAQVPGLSAACSLTIEVIKSVQISKNNTAKLQYLAHYIAGQLISIAENMQGRWDIAPDKLKKYIDEYEMILHDVLKAVAKLSKTSRFLALVNSGERNIEITKLQRRLEDVQTSILLLIGMDTSLAVNQLHKTVASQRILGLDTYSGVVRLEDSLDRLAMRSGVNRTDEADIKTYTRGEIQLHRTMFRYHTHHNLYGRALAIVLHEAECTSDGRAVLVKTYKEITSTEDTELASGFVQDLTTRKRLWDPSIIQLIGSSQSTASIPFQVYHSFGGHLEAFPEWFHRTLDTNPMETLNGLYDMRTSLKALMDFQRDQSILCSPEPLWESLVNTQPCGSRLKWTITYTGELAKGEPLEMSNMPCKVYEIMNGDAYFDGRCGPNQRVVAAFCGGSKAWVEDTRDLEEIFNGGMKTRSLADLAGALFESGYLGTCFRLVHPRRNICLGDIGYTAENGEFTVISNLHRHLASADGRAPTWQSSRSESTNMNEPPNYMHTRVLEYLGKTYKRHEYKPHQFLNHTQVKLSYNNLDERHSWKLLQHSACQILVQFGLSIPPHALQLVTSVQHECASWLRDETSAFHGGTNAVYDQPLPFPTVYVFGKCGDVHIWDSGTPELAMRSCASFENQPNWLDDDQSWGPSDGLQSGWMKGEEEKDGFYLLNQTDCYIHCLQLPPGVAVPYAEETDAL